MCGTAVANGVGLGTGRPGAYAERVIVDARMLFALPDAVDDRAGTLVEPTAVAVHALAGRAAAGRAAVVVGAGPIGLLTALVARERRASRSCSSRAIPAARRAPRGSACETVTPDDSAAALADDPPAIVMECAGTASAAALALELVAPLGRIVIVGIAPEPLAFDPLPLDLQGGRHPRRDHLPPRRLRRCDRAARVGDGSRAPR